MQTEFGINRWDMRIIKNNKLFCLPFLGLLFVVVWNYSIVKQISLNTNTEFLYILYGLLVFSGPASLFLLYFLLFRIKRKFNLGLIAALSIFILGILYTIYLPPLSAPDEPSHYISAYKLSNKLLAKEVTNEEGYVLIRAKDFSMENLDGNVEIINKKEQNVDYIEKSKNSTLTSLYLNVDFSLYDRIYRSGIDNDLDIYKNTLARSSYIPVNTTPLVYIPSAIGISIARILDLDTIGLLFLGRLFNLLFFSIIVGLAIAIMPFLKEVMYLIALFPMSLNLASSFSYDAMLIALIFLFIAYVLKLTYQKEKIKERDILILCVLVALFTPCKIVYFPIIGLIFILPREKFKNNKFYMIALICIILSAIVSFAIVNTKILSSYINETSGSTNILESEEVARYTLKYLLTRPRELISLYYLTILNRLEFYHTSMIGAFIGNNNFDIITAIGVPYIFTIFISISLLLSSLNYYNNREEKISGKKNIYCIFIFLAISFLLMLSMLVAITPMSSRIILGVQGRYFIPILLLIFLGFRNFPINLAKNIRNELIFLVYAANIYILINIFSLAITR